MRSITIFLQGAVLVALLLVSGRAYAQPCEFDDTCPGNLVCNSGACGPLRLNNNLIFANNRNLDLLEPLDGGAKVLPAQPQMKMAFTYFNRMFPFVLGVAAGFAVLQAIVGGYQIMVSGGSDGLSKGKERILWALGGLVIIAFIGFFLRFLNSAFFL